MVKIAASILAANMENLSEEIESICNDGVDFIHIDVMDGKFVSNKTDGKRMMKLSVKNSSVPLDVHLMVEHPFRHLKSYLKADCITFHVETTSEKELFKIIEYLHERNIKVGLSVKPNTNVEIVEKHIKYIDKVLVMTVEPGYGGQEMIADTLKKVTDLRDKYSSLDIQVDGGINLNTYHEAIKAGANILVIGTGIFKAENRKEIIQIYRGGVIDDLQ